MPYPYKKMTEEDFAYIRSVTSDDRVWVGDEIAREFYRADLLVHARHAVWQSGGVRGHGARGAGAAVYPDGDRVPRA